MRLFLQYQKDLPFFLLFFRIFFYENGIRSGKMGGKGLEIKLEMRRINIRICF